jgi:hypothetical protein
VHGFGGFTSGRCMTPPTCWAGEKEFEHLYLTVREGEGRGRLFKDQSWAARIGVGWWHFPRSQLLYYSATPQQQEAKRPRLQAVAAAAAAAAAASPSRAHRSTIGALPDYEAWTWSESPNPPSQRLEELHTSPALHSVLRSRQDGPASSQKRSKA